MFYREKDNIYIKMPVNFAVVLNQAIVQASFSMHQDNNSPPDSVNSSQFNLIQLANLLNNAKFLTETESNITSKIFNHKENTENDSTEQN